MTRENLTATLRLDAHALLGEGPIWDPDTGAILWVDIIGRQLHRFDPLTELPVSNFKTDCEVGAIALRRSGGLVLMDSAGFLLIDSSGCREHAIPVEVNVPRNRMNDGKVDPAGRLWAGTMAHDGSPGAGSLYRLDPDLSVTRVLTNLTISNGIGWSPDGFTMYHVDSRTQRVDAYSFDPKVGQISDRRRFVDISPDDGIPDGLAVDTEGGIWVALWGGGSVRRFTTSGALDRVVDVPCRFVTSCTFGGERLDELFITTASVGITADDPDRQRGAGGLFSCRPGVIGLGPTPFAG